MGFSISLLIAVALLVWSVVGIMTIYYYVMYHRLMKPIFKPMVKMYQQMYTEFERDEA